MSETNGKVDLEACQQALGIRVRDTRLLEKALTHASTGEGLTAHNERLELLGDAVLTLLITEYLHDKHPNFTEGELTELKGSIVSGADLAFTGARLGLEKWIRVGRGIAKERSLPRSILANTFEALVGAIYLDGGLEPARLFAIPALQEQIARALNGARNFKMRFQNYAQKTYGEVPSYRILDRSGPPFARAFQARAVLRGVEYPPAWGKTKKEAEQWAAREALLVIESPPEEPEVEDREPGH